MPFMDGMGLCSYIYDNYPHIKVVLLSGYKEFDYAQEAIRLNVKDYLLKPIDDNKLTSLILKLTNEIYQDQLNKKRDTDSMELARRDFLISLIKNKYDKDEIASNLLKYDFKVEKFIKMIVIKCNDYFNTTYHAKHMDGNLLKSTIYNICLELIQDNGAAFEYANDAIAIIMTSEKSINQLTRNIKTILHSLISYNKEFIKTDLSIGISANIDSIGELSKAYLQCQQTFNFIPLNNPLSYVFYDDILSLNQNFPE